VLLKVSVELVYVIITDNFQYTTSNWQGKPKCFFSSLLKRKHALHSFTKCLNWQLEAAVFGQ